MSMSDKPLNNIPVCHVHVFFSLSTAGAHKLAFPLFGLSELANVYVPRPINPIIDAAAGGHFVTFLQHYTPMVKGMEEHVPLSVRPHLLTYLLGAGYIKRRAKFKHVSQEVDTQRTLHELLELVHPTIPFAARMELVITDSDASFLSSFHHKRLARAVLWEGLLIKVSSSEFCHPILNKVHDR